MNTTYSTKKRLLALLIATAFIFLLVVVRLGYIQLVEGQNLQRKAIDQWTRDLPINAKRGDILDSLGRVIATSKSSYSIYVRGKSIKDANYVATILSEKLNLNYDKVLEKVKNKNISELTLARQVDESIANQIREYNLEGVYLASDSSRSYTYGDFLTQVLGFVSIDNEGQTGLEKYYDKYLKGIKGGIYTQTDLIGVELKDRPMYYVEGIDGMNIVLTIDSVIQSICENVLQTINYVHKPKASRIIVMNPNDGQIVAMASSPSFDLNNPPRDDLEKLMEYSRNALLTDIYEPGSTFKILTAAANIEEASRGNAKAFTDNHVFHNNSNYRVVSGKKISCWTTHNAGKHCNQNLAMALNNSCNPIFTDIALGLGKNTFYNYLDKFGYGKVSGIDFLGEQSGMLVPKTLVTEGDLARIGFGQTIAVTPMQLINATAAAINGGVLYQPSLVGEIKTNDNKIVKTFPSIIKNRVVSELTSSKVVSMMEGVVSDGSGKQCFIPGYRVGGKTGTAQKYLNGAIAEGKYVSSFVGFFPANKPQYIALVIVDEPEGAHYGSTVAAPYAKLIFEQIINYKSIKPVQ